MGQYKVPQNVEAEDKILGPLTFRQFIYALIGTGWGLICFALLNKIPAVMIILGFPPTMLFLLLAFYSRDGQNFEQLLIAMLGFFVAPHRRLWVKEDLAETFHVEPTKHAAEISQRNPEDVMSELEKVAKLIDSRGWNRPPEPESANIIQPSTQHQDRIVVPQPAPLPPDEPNSDMLDLKRSPLAQNLAQLLADAAADVREEAMQQMNQTVHRPSAPEVTAPSTSDILKLATQSDELTVSQIAAQATRRMAPTQAMQGGQVVEPPKNAR